jgi:hypothetical protein
MSSWSAEAGKSELESAVTKTATLILDCLGNYGYPVNFSHMAHDGCGDYAIFCVDVAHLPAWVSLNHLRHPRLLAMMKLCLRREVAVTNGRGNVNYIVALNNGREPEPVH